MELFEQIRREYEHGVGTVAGVARKFGVHRRMVRQAVASAIPPGRKVPEREIHPAVKPENVLAMWDEVERCGYYECAGAPVTSLTPPCR